MDTTAASHTPLWTLPQGYGVSSAEAITFTAAELATGRQQRDAQGNLR